MEKKNIEMKKEVVAPVQEQLEAYNSRNIERFLACYSKNVIVEDPEGNIIMEGEEQFRARYEKLFASSPNLHCELLSRMNINNYVIDEEMVTGFGMEGSSSEIHTAAVYLVENGKITKVRFVR